MRKLFTLLTLLVVCVTGAWADVNTTLIDGITLPSLPSGTYEGGTTVSHNGTNTAVVVDANGNSVMQAIAPAYGSPTASNFTWTNACDPTDGSWSTTGATWEAPNNSVFVGSTAYTTSTNAHYVNFARRGNIRNNRTFAYRFTNCGGVSALVKSQGKTDDAAACLAVYEVGAGNALTSAGSASSKTNAVDIITVDGLSSSKTYVAYIYGMNGSNGELYEVAFIPSTTDPTISASPKSVTLAATESGVAVESSFTISGANLTAGTYNLTIPSVTGLEVSPTSFTVAANGTVSQVVNLSYSSTENVPANSVNITATVDEVNLSVAVNYSASVDTWELQTISTAKTWDFSKLSGGVQYSDEDLSVEHVYANIAEITCPDGFDGTALAFTGEFPLRDGKGIAQNGTLRFNTSVPGYIVVKFSDTGTSKSTTAVKRYLVVNGKTTEYWASRENNGTENPYEAQLNVTTEDIAVPAGDVTISGTSALVYSKVTFTPTVSKTISSKGWSTYCSPYILDFSNEIEGLTAAYIVTGGNNGVLSTTPVEGPVPANTGLLLEGTENASVTIPVAATATVDVSGNKLVGVTASETLPAEGGYVLMTSPSLAFYKNSNAFTLSANSAYLPAGFTAGAARGSYLLFGDDVTGISQVTNAAAKVGKAVYNLNGQRVNQPTKGLYIIDGKKVAIP